MQFVWIFIGGTCFRMSGACRSTSLRSSVYPEHYRDVFVAVQAVRNEKRNDHHVPRLGERQPIGDERRLLHVNVPDRGVFPARANHFRLALGRDGAVVVQARSVTDDQQRCIGHGNIGRDFPGALQQQLRHPGMVPAWLAIFPRLAARALGRWSRQFQFPGYNRAREITFADEIWNDVDLADRVIAKE